MFVLMRPVHYSGVAALSAGLGENGQVAKDQSNGDIYCKLSGTWTKVADGTGAGVALPVNGAVTVKNSSGSITRSLTAVAGVVTLAATDTIVANGGTAVLQNSSGTTSSGNSGLNSPATAIVSAGVLTAVKASA